MKNFISILIISLFFTFNVNADTDGEITISQNVDNKEVKDCFEPVNRGIFAFNRAIDGLVFKPAAQIYKAVPSPIRNGTSNTLNNLSNLVTIPNNVLQGDFKDAAHNSMRFVINSTVGILGFVDVASWIGLDKKDKEDYGQTLGTWGVGPGCYLILPILGPSTARDSIGSLVNISGGDPWYNVTVRNDTQYFSDMDYYTSKITTGIDFRAKNLTSIDSLEKNSIDLYAAVRSLYLQDRKRKVNNSKKITETLDDSDWEEIDIQ